MTPEFKKYYDDEMRYLKESGAEFAKAYPDIGSFLVDGEDTDPYVERLLEGFAFITARCRENLSFEFEQMSSQFMELFAPMQLREFPSVTLLQCKNISNREEFLPKGSLVSNNQNFRSPKAIQFSTTSDLSILPINLNNCSLNSRGTTCSLDFGLFPKAHSSDISATTIPLYINGDNELVWSIMHTLTQEVESVSITVDGKEYPTSLPQIIAFDEEHALTPLNLGEMSSAHLLREFFIFKETFRRIAFTIPSAVALQAYRSFTFNLNFKKPMDSRLQEYIHKDNFELNVVPAVNLFIDKTEPVNVTHRKHEYFIKPANSNKLRIHSLISVEGIAKESNMKRAYRPHDTYAASNFNNSYYTMTTRKDIYGNPCYYISVYSPHDETVIEEYLSIDAYLSHGVRARKEVLLHQLNYLKSPITPDSITITNITKPSIPIEAVLPKAHLWNIFSGINQSLGTFCTAGNMKELLHHFAQFSHPGNKQYIDTIIDVTSKHTSIPHHGTLYPAVTISIFFKDERIKEYSKDSLGVLSLLGLTLHTFLSANVAMNTMVNLIFDIAPVGITYRWDASVHSF
ncbi:MAG: type VI secretion system baseplate subunit TssF [Fibrobacterales bacterium]